MSSPYETLPSSGCCLLAPDFTADCRQPEWTKISRSSVKEITQPRAHDIGLSDKWRTGIHR